MATRVDVKEIRDRLALNRTSFGKRFPVSSRTVRRWENGEAAPSQMASQRLQELKTEAAKRGPQRRIAEL